MTATKCKHRRTSLITEAQPAGAPRAVCLGCDDCGAVFGLKAKDRRAANELLKEKAQHGK